MNTLLLPEAGRRRRRYSSEFKAEIITACMQPGVSTTAIALANQINPNLVRRWVRQRQLSATEPSTVPALIPVCVSDLVALPSKLDDSDQVNPIKPEPKRSIQSSPPPLPSSVPTELIRCEVQRGDLKLNVAWPASQAEVCVRWLRDLLQ